MYASADEAILSSAVAAIENGYENEAGGMSRFPGLTPFASFPGNKTYLTTWQDNLIAATDLGRVYRVSKLGAVQDVTGVPLSGGGRAIFSKTEDQLVMAAGGPILQLLGNQTQILSNEAPQSTHIAFLSGYLIAIEPYSGRFYYCDPGQYTTWNALSVFTANAKAQFVGAITITPFNEMLLAGPDAIEQWELLANGNQPFARRWTTGEGIYAPYTLLADKVGTFGINPRFEFVRFAGQVSQDQSDDVGLTLQKIDDWSEAWSVECSTKGQKFFILQMPNATNAYGSKGVTLAFDYRDRKFSFLYGWDKTIRQPTRWPGWSAQRQWGKVFVGVPGGIAVLDDENYTLQGSLYPFLIRSGHVDDWGPSRIDDVKIRLKRGIGNYGGRRPRVGIRVNRDNLGFDQWTFEDLGDPGERTMEIRFGGQGTVDGTWQFEIAVTDDVPVEFVSMQVFVERLRW